MSKAKGGKGGTKLKAIMLGEGRVGKSSLLKKFLTGSFDEGEESTLEAKMHQGVKMEACGAIWDVFLWDTAGQERFRALGPIYYRDADGAMLTYDITDKDSWTRVRVWLRELQKVVGDNITVVVVGNKCDLERERKVNKKEVDDWCSENNCIHILASAKLGIRVQEAYQQLVAGIAAKRAADSGAAASAAAAQNRGGDIGGDILPGRAPRKKGVTVTLDEEPMNRAGGGGGASSGGGGGSSSGGGGGGNNNKGCPC